MCSVVMEAGYLGQAVQASQAHDTETKYSRNINTRNYDNESIFYYLSISSQDPITKTD